MKQLFENFNKYVNEMSMSSEEDLNTQIALVIARSGLQDTSLGMSDDDLKDLVVYIYEKEFDKTGEGWNPYDEDLAQIRDVLTPDDEEDRDNYDFDLSEIIREEVRLFLEKRKKRKKKKKKSSGKKDACYHKVRSRYDVWPSAYASGALVKCRKVGAKNWGNKSKRKK